MIRSAAAGVGNVLVLFGASTGRDGIGGASVLASAELGDADDVQAPDRPGRRPVRGEQAARVLAGAARPPGCWSSLQDLGAAGLTSSAGEMAAKGGVGLDIDVDAGAAARGRHGAVRDHGLRVPGADALRRRARRGRRRCWRCARSGRCAARAIGEVTGTGRMRVCAATSWSATCRSPALVDDCPLYDLAPAEPGGAAVPGARARCSARRRRARRRCSRCSASPNLASRRPLFEQYDCGRAVAHRAPARAGRRRRALAADMGEGALARDAIDGNGRRVAADPYRGTVEACWSARPTSPASAPSRSGSTNYLNFGNPEKPHIAWQLTEAVRGLGDACRALEAPVVGGNVSLYNEGAAGPIYPTPVVGMVGRAARPAPRRPPRLRARGRRDRARRLGRPRRRWPRSELAKLRGEPLPDGLPAVDVGEVRACSTRSARRCAAGALTSAHDIAEGGLRGRAGRVLPGRRARRRRWTCGDSGDVGRPVRRAPGRLRRLRPARGAGPRSASDPGRRLRHGRRRRARRAIGSLRERWSLAELRERDERARAALPLEVPGDARWVRQRAMRSAEILVGLLGAVSRPAPARRAPRSACRRRSCRCSAALLVGLRARPAAGRTSTRTSVFFVFLPPLLYGAGVQLVAARPARAAHGRSASWRSALVAATTVAVAVAVHALVPGFGWPEAFVLGAVLAPTDPVAAVAVDAARSRIRAAARRRSSRASRWSTTASALVLYRLAVGATVAGVVLGRSTAAWQLRRHGGVGRRARSASPSAWLIGRLRGRIDDAPNEITLSLLHAVRRLHRAPRRSASRASSPRSRSGLYLGSRSDGLFSARRADRGPAASGTRCIFLAGVDARSC